MTKCSVFVRGVGEGGGVGKGLRLSFEHSTGVLPELNMYEQLHVP